MLDVQKMMGINIPFLLNASNKVGCNVCLQLCLIFTLVVLCPKKSNGKQELVTA